MIWSTFLITTVTLADLSLSNNEKTPASAGVLTIIYGGERGIRTLDTLLTYTPLAGARLQPLGHFSVIVLVGSEYIVSEKTTPP